MVNAVYDHIIAILVVCVMFVSAVVILPTLSITSFKAVDQQQLRNTALNIFNAMLLDTGEPVDWGSDPFFSFDKVSKFGLARAGDSIFYVLDPDKVQRLVKGNPIGELPYYKVKELLKLQGYDFAFQIIPPFNITNVGGTKIDEYHSPINEPLLSQKKLQYAIKVSDLYGRPIPNAVIQGTAIYTDKNKFYLTNLGKTTTNAVGIAEDTIDLESVPWHLMVILRVSVADVATVVVTFGKNPVKVIDINIAGDTVILTRPKDAPNAAVEIKNVYVYGSQGDLSFLYKGQGPPYDKFNTGSGQHRLWNHTFNGLQDYDPIVLIFHIETVPEGQSGGWQDVVVAGPYQAFLGHTVFNYGSPPQGGGAIRLQRSVNIAGLTYIAELWLWKESP